MIYPKHPMLVFGLAFLASTAPPETIADTQVNTYTSADQVTPSISTASDGDFVVVWQSAGSSDTDTSGTSIQGQRFTSDGMPAGGEFQINTYTFGAQVAAAVAAEANGDFVVVWQSAGSYTDFYGSAILGQRFASDGSVIGGEFQVNTYTTGYQTQPSVAADDDGDFVVVWQSDEATNDPSETSIQGQRFNSSGSVAGAQFQVNSYTTSYQTVPAVSSDSDGDFVVVWQSNGGYSDPSSTSIQGKRYLSNGATLGGQFQVNTYTTGAQEFAAVARDANGSFVVVWTSAGSSESDTLGDSIQGKRYDSSGSVLGGQFQVNLYTTGVQTLPSVAVEEGGNFVVVWESQYSATDSDYSILGRRYLSGGSPFGGELQINTVLTDDQTEPSVGIEPDGEFVVVWTSFTSNGDDSSNRSVQKSDAQQVPVELIRFDVD